MTFSGVGFSQKRLRKYFVPLNIELCYIFNKLELTHMPVYFGNVLKTFVYIKKACFVELETTDNKT